MDLNPYLHFNGNCEAAGFSRANRILSRPTVEVMTTDQLTPEQKAASPLFPRFWDSHGWGLGFAMVTHRDGTATVPGCYGGMAASAPIGVPIRARTWWQSY